jgi:hypothetical protein
MTKILIGCLCIGCYGTSALAGNEATMDIDEKSIDEKRKILFSKHNLHDVNDFTLAQVKELYKAIVVDWLAERDRTQKIKFPSKPTCFFDAEPVSYFDFNNGGGFLRNNKLSIQNVALVISILAEMVTYSFLDDKTKKKNEQAILDQQYTSLQALKRKEYEENDEGRLELCIEHVHLLSS